MSGIRDPLAGRYDRDRPVTMVSVDESGIGPHKRAHTSASTSTTTSYPRFAIAMVVYGDLISKASKTP